MVKIAFAGGRGDVAQEVTDVLVASKKHEILILSREDGPTTNGIRRVKVDYHDPEQLTQVLQGVHTVLSFIAPFGDAGRNVQETLIDAAVKAGVKRFAPSEWSASTVKKDQLGWYAFKEDARKYLENLNKDKKVIEYTLFQPGFFINYLTRPYQSANHLTLMETPWDFQNRRAILMEGTDDDRISLTTVQDVANVVARAIDYEGVWPVISGIQGAVVTIGELMALGEKLRGPFAYDILKADDVQKNTFSTKWAPDTSHPSIPAEAVAEVSKIIVRGFLLSIHEGSWRSSDEWNKLLPDYKFSQPEEFLTKYWAGKP